MDLKVNFPPKRGKKNNYVFMNGGSLYVPQDKFLSFVRTYISVVRNPCEKVCLVEECDSEEFNYFLDIDYKNTNALSIDDVKKITREIVSILAIGKCVVFVAHPRPVENNLIKSGIHLIWPKTPVNYDTAIEYRQKILDIKGKGWETILDKSVYKTGLRLPWSYKYDHKNRKFELPYLPLCIVEASGNIRILDTKPDEHIFQLSSIRVRSSKQREGWFSKQQMQNEVENPELLKNCEIFINRSFRGHGNTQVKNVWKQGTTEYYFLSVNSRYCENKGGNHTSNHVYFVISSSGRIYQKCFCRSDCVGKKGITCEKFKGQPHLLPGSMLKELFPPT